MTEHRQQQLLEIAKELLDFHHPTRIRKKDELLRFSELLWKAQRVVAEIENEEIEEEEKQRTNAPRLTTFQRDSLSDLPIESIIFNTTICRLQRFDGISWNDFEDEGGK